MDGVYLVQDNLYIYKNSDYNNYRFAFPSFSVKKIIMRCDTLIVITFSKRNNFKI